jgi:predicted transcriptional regulator with HTH domain
MSAVLLKTCTVLLQVITVMSHLTKELSQNGLKYAKLNLCVKKVKNLASHVQASFITDNF